MISFFGSVMGVIAGIVVGLAMQQMGNEFLAAGATLLTMWPRHRDVGGVRQVGSSALQRDAVGGHRRL